MRIFSIENIQALNIVNISLNINMSYVSISGKLLGTKQRRCKFKTISLIENRFSFEELFNNQSLTIQLQVLMLFETHYSSICMTIEHRVIYIAQWLQIISGLSSMLFRSGSWHANCCSRFANLILCRGPRFEALRPVEKACFPQDAQYGVLVV